MPPAEIHAVVVAAYHDRRVPMPSHIDVAFRRAVSLARAAGVRFRAGECAVWCYAGRAEEPSVCFFADNPVRIYVNTTPGRTAAEWVRHFLHELAHAFFDARQDIGVLQREARADAFAARAMQGWR
jgi:hypothetical protein